MAGDLDLVLRCIDLTTLEGTDTPSTVRALCARAREHSVAAVCVYPIFVRVARAALEGSTVRVAAVSGGFPSAQTFLDVRLAEIRRTAEEGADEIDVVMNRGAFLAGELARVHDEIAASKEASGRARMKVILETGELGALDAVRRAAEIALDAGADWLKTSTGKVAPAATREASRAMLEAIRDRGRAVGFKAAGGIRTAAQALEYLRLAEETLGEAQLSPDRFRIGASALLEDVLREINGDRAASRSRPTPP